MKVYKDLIDLEASDINSSYKRLMEEKPNFDKRDNSKVVYRRKEYIIIKARKDYIVINTKCKNEFNHSHTLFFNYAKSLIDLCVRKKIPTRHDRRTIESLMRLSRDNKYIEKLRKLK